MKSKQQVSRKASRKSTDQDGEKSPYSPGRAQFLRTGQAALIKEHVSAVIAQRCDDFRSPQFLWLSAVVLRQALRPSDKRALEALTGAFNRWFGTNIRVDDILASSELSSRSFLDEWASAIQLCSDQTASELAQLAAQCGREPSRFRSFIDTVLRQIPDDNDATSDIAEDRGGMGRLSPQYRQNDWT